MGNLDLVEEQEAVVHGVVPKLGPNVANMDVLQWLVSFQVSDLHDKRVRPIGFTINDELRHYNGMVGGFT